ncbi:MAG: hypothetical protein ACQES9_13430 [Myxococcota bacterium]
MNIIYYVIFTILLVFTTGACTSGDKPEFGQKNRAKSGKEKKKTVNTQNRSKNSSAKEINVKNTENKKGYFLGKGKIGKLEPGKPLPDYWAKQKKQLIKNYFFSYYGDGLSFEGFSLKNPPVKIAIKDGPYANMQNSEKPISRNPTPEFKAILAGMNFGKLIVKMLVLEQPELKTKKGIGVGSTLKKIKEAYGKISSNPVPPTFGKDRFAVRTKDLPKVVFYFENKYEAEIGGKVVRIIIF